MKQTEYCFIALQQLRVILENEAIGIAFCIGRNNSCSEAKKHFKEVKVAKLPTVESVIELVNLHFVKQ